MRTARSVVRQFGAVGRRHLPEAQPSLCCKNLEPPARPAALDVENGTIGAARVACGGVGTRPWRMRSCERALIGKPPNRSTFEAAAQFALQGAHSLSGNGYKVELPPRTIVRTLEMAGDVP